MTATEQLIAKQVSDALPGLGRRPAARRTAARRGLIAPLRCLRVPPAAAINSVPIVGGDFEERALAAALDHQAFDPGCSEPVPAAIPRSTPGIVYAAGVDHAYNLAQEFRAAGLKAEAVSGRTPPARLAPKRSPHTSAGRSTSSSTRCSSPRAGTRRARPCACTSHRRRRDASTSNESAGIMRIDPRRQAGVVVQPGSGEGATHSERVASRRAVAAARAAPTEPSTSRSPAPLWCWPAPSRSPPRC